MHSLGALRPSLSPKALSHLLARVPGVEFSSAGLSTLLHGLARMGVRVGDLDYNATHALTRNLLSAPHTPQVRAS